MLVIVDDVPWIDRATAGVLGFVARRLAGSRVGFLAASRTGEEGFFERSGLPARELAPLDNQAAQSLLADHFPALAPALRQRVLSEAQGNPLALLELPAALTERGDSAPPAVTRQPTAQNGGSASGYQPGLRLVDHLTASGYGPTRQRTTRIFIHRRFGVKSG